MKRYLFSQIALFMALIAQAASYTTVTIDQIPYRLYDETMEAHVYLNSSSTTLTVTNNRLELPEKVTNAEKEYTVTEIEYFSCGNTVLELVTPKTMTRVVSVKKGVKTLTLGAAVTSVNDLHESTNLQSFVVAEGNAHFSVDEYGILYNKDKTTLRYAPYGNRSSFTSFTVPSTVTVIGGEAFVKFDKLQSVTIPSSVKTIDRSAFNGCGQLLSVTLLEGLESINDYAFENCGNLTNCKFPNSLKSIGKHAFYSCSLSNFSLPEQLRTIGEEAFRYGIKNSALSTLVIPEYVQSIGGLAFYGVTIDEVIVHSIPFELSTDNVFGSPYKTLVVPKGTRDIFGTREGWKRFNKIIEGDFEPTFNVSDYPPGDWSLPSDGYEITQDKVTYKLYRSGVARVYTQSYPASGELVIPESVYAVGHTFPVDGVEYFKTSSGCIVDLKLPNTITFVNSVKGGVQVLTLPASVTSVSGLHESTNLQSFVVAEGNAHFSVDEYGILYNKDKTTLRYAPYGNRSSFTSFTVPSTVTVIGGEAFVKFDKLQSVTIPSSVKTIDRSAFNGCGQLLSVTLLEGLESINDYAFENCGNLTNCKFPNSLKSIGKHAFYSCSLSNFSLPEQLRTIGEEAFRYGIKNSALSTLVIPEYVQSIGDYAFDGVTINEVHSRIMEPQPIGTSNVFGSTTNQILVVPTGTKSLYEATAGWNRIPVINESDDLLPTSVRCLKPVITRSGNILTITAQPEDAKIYYTLDGKEPTANSNLYDKPIEMVGNCTVKAIALKEGLKDSPVASFTVDWFTVADVEIRVTDDLAIEMTTQTEGATIRYTLDGTDPTENGYVYPNKPVSIGNDCTIKAVGIKNNFNNSKITSYVLNWAQLTCPKPTFRLSGTKLYIEATLADVTVYYTMDGTEPTKSSPQYVLGEPIELTSNITIKAFCTKKGYRDSEVGTYVTSAFNVSSPIITREGNTISITTETVGATIYYTLDGSEPTKNSTPYDAANPIVASRNCTIKAIAFKDGYNNSPVMTFTVDWFTVADVEIRVTDDLAIEMTTQTEGATIRYTLDGTDPTENGYVYPNKPVSIGNDCTIKAVGIKNNFNNSKITSYVLNWAQLTCPKPTFRLSGTKLYIEATLADVTVYYTMDGTEPTKSSPQYVLGEPIELTSNITIKAFCTKKGYRDSEVGTYVTSAFNVSSPIITREGNTISITTETVGATIYYTLDGSEPTKNSTPYDAANPIVASRNCTIKAIAFKDGYNNSPVMTFTVDWFTVADVVIRVLENLSVEMNTDTEGATIYYTKDGNDPTVNSSIYDAGHPFVLTENCTIKAIAMKKDYKSSQITKVVVDWLKVANVRIRLNDDLEIEMTTDTEGATIKYTDDGSDPAENGKVYPGRPMSFLSDCTIKAIGTKTGFNDSEITVFSLQWAQWTCPKPTFRYSGKKLYIETVMEGANIYYTIDGDEPTKNSTQYTLGVPIELAQNCTVRAIVTKPGYRNSEPATEVVEIFVVSPPSFELQADNRLKITCNDPADAAIYYGIGEDAELSILYQNPIILTDNRVIRAIAKKSGYKDSPIESYNPTQVACEEPSLENYDGRFFTLKVPEGATVYYAQNGDPYSGEMYREKGEVKGLGTLRCVAKHPYKNDSKVVDIPINYYYGGDGLAEVNGVGVLQNSFGWSGTDDITALNVRGPLNATDLEFIKTKFQQLQHLNLEQTTIKERALTTGAFAGMPSLVTFYSPKDIINVGDRIFANCPRLAAIVWNASEKIPDNALGEQKNPNLLVYAGNRLLAPAGVVNVVQNGSASSIVLTDVSEGNNNFYCPIAFKAERISYTHNYSMETKVGECQGWETIALPFTVQKIMHQSKGELTPFKKFEEEGSSENARPFWLRALTPTGFEDVATLEANTPYIICMPNSTAYASRYNVNGNVTFSAENTEVPATEMTVVEKGENAFTATFLKKEKNSSVWPINKNEEYMGYMPGSAFVPNLRDVRPFEAYAYNRNSLSAPRILSLAEIGGTSGTTGILLMLNDEQKNDGAWYTVDGRKLQQKPTTKGVYIKNGKKIIMK